MYFAMGLILGAWLMSFATQAWVAHCEWCLKESKDINNEAKAFLDADVKVRDELREYLQTITNTP